MTLPARVPYPANGSPHWSSVGGGGAASSGHASPFVGAGANWASSAAAASNPCTGSAEIALLEVQLLEDFGDQAALAELRAAYTSSEQKYQAELLQRGASARANTCQK